MRKNIWINFLNELLRFVNVAILLGKTHTVVVDLLHSLVAYLSNELVYIKVIKRSLFFKNNTI